jgi:Ca2+/H+ antiporter, TMEM165/GDT1 family
VLGRCEKERAMDIAIEAAWTPMLAAFLASLVEFVEALTVVLAVGTVRGWRPTLAGTGLALAVLLALVVILGPALTHIPLDVVQFVVGTLLLLFGMRWLRKAILRAAGVIALHDEEAAFAHETQNMQRHGRNYSAGLDRVAVAAAFKIVMLEGIEVVFIVVAIGAAGQMLWPASIGAVAALAVVILLGVVVHRPLARVPENTLKFFVGVLLSAFGTFWAGEGIGVIWPGGDSALLVLIAVFLILALLLVPIARARRARIA